MVGPYHENRECMRPGFVLNSGSIHGSGQKTSIAGTGKPIRRRRARNLGSEGGSRVQDQRSC